MKNENQKYFKVLAKCGHLGRRSYIPIQFAIIAESGKEAAKEARNCPRVKHHHKDAILGVNEINYEQFQEINEINKKDPYLNCHSRHEQNSIDLEDRILFDDHSLVETYDKYERKERVAHKLRKFTLIEKAGWEDCDYDYAY